MPVVTDDLVGAHWTDVYEAAQEGTFGKSVGAAKLGLRVKHLPDEKRSAGGKRNLKQLLSWDNDSYNVSLQFMERAGHKFIFFFLCLVQDQSGSLCHEVMRSFMTNNYVMS